MFSITNFLVIRSQINAKNVEKAGETVALKRLEVLSKRPDFGEFFTFLAQAAKS